MKLMKTHLLYNIPALDTTAEHILFVDERRYGKSRLRCRYNHVMVERAFVIRYVLLFYIHPTDMFR